jgi:predicted PurR-regulated permease PerM
VSSPLPSTPCICAWSAGWRGRAKLALTLFTLLALAILIVPSVFAGIIGLFVGSVVLALSYRLFVAWLEQDFHLDEPPDDAGKTGEAV